MRQQYDELVKLFQSLLHTGPAPDFSGYECIYLTAPIPGFASEVCLKTRPLQPASVPAEMKLIAENLALAVTKALNQ